MSGVLLGRINRGTRVLSVVIVLAMIAVMVYALWPDPPQTRVTAYFPRTVGLYEGSDVRVLGVPVGRVDRIVGQGTRARVEMSFDAEQKVPADAKAAVLAPSVVADRYVQLTPVYRHGPAMKDGATISEDRTAVPVELDRIYQSVNDLAVALGPEGANKSGALSRLLDTGAKNLKGQGGKLNQTIGDVADLSETIGDNRKDLFSTVRQLQKFTSTLADSDKDVRRFNTSLAKVADQLSAERDDLQGALTSLSTALSQVSAFVKENRGALKSNVSGLTKLSKTLVKQQDALAEVLETSPVALQNLDRTYHSESGTLDTRNNFSQLRDPDQYLCSLLTELGQPKSLCELLSELLGGLEGPVLPANSNQPANSNRKDAGAEGAAGGTTPGRPDRTLGGLLEPEEGR